ncbi:hypothetical protein [Niallia sp. MER 6]|uniref:DUF6060 domain-containing protein n=1 Tax=Niallia sp. MER 6 TaxID=2939567 RepID=UPI00203A715C|nr:hypothetical protein [Niallia sp. MER 6]MCM3032971.1 hypothetical protein [Niallia sp. MER 6]
MATFYDEELKAEISPFIVTESGLIPVSEEEYKESTNISEVENLENEFIDNSESSVAKLVTTINSNQTVTPYADIDWVTWRYKEKSATKYYGDSIKVSASIDCNTKTCRVDKQWSATVSKSYSASAKTEVKAIDVGASFTLTTAKSSSSTYSFTVNKCQAGYVAFKPYKRKSTGTLSQVSEMRGVLKSKSAYARSAIKLKSGEFR